MKNKIYIKTSVNIFISIFCNMATNLELLYRPFRKTLPRSIAFLNWISVKFYETLKSTQLETLEFVGEGKAAGGMVPLGKVKTQILPLLQ